MKMTLPFKPHVLALICSAGLCAASTGLYIKSRTVEAPVEPQSTQLAVSDAAAVTFPATVSAPPVTPAVVKSAFSTAQIDQWVAPVALYPDALLSQVLMASTYPTNVAQAVQWSHDNPLKQGDAAIQAVSDQPWDASVKSLVAFPQLMALMGENPQWVQNLGDAFLAQPQDVMDSVQRLRQLAQQTGSLKSSTEQKVITTTKKAVPVKQTVTAPVIPSNTVLTANPVITEPGCQLSSISEVKSPRIWLICGCSGRLSKSVRLSVNSGCALHAERTVDHTDNSTADGVRWASAARFFSRCQRVLSSAPFRRAKRGVSTS